MKAICNASPLILLTKAGLIDILPKLYEEIAIPTAVVSEVLAGPVEDPLRRRIGELSWLQQVRLAPAITPLATWQLGLGEAEVLEWARLHGGYEALLDDLAARRAAVALGVPVVGTLGLIARAAEQGVGPDFEDGVRRLQAAGIYLKPTVIDALRRELSN